MFPSKFLQFPSILTHFHAANEKFQMADAISPYLAVSCGLRHFLVMLYFAPGLYHSPVLHRQHAMAWTKNDTDYWCVSSQLVKIWVRKFQRKYNFCNMIKKSSLELPELPEKHFPAWNNRMHTTYGFPFHQITFVLFSQQTVCPNNFCILTVCDDIVHNTKNG